MLSGFKLEHRLYSTLENLKVYFYNTASYSKRDFRYARALMTFLHYTWNYWNDNNVVCLMLIICIPRN